jgi:hypothetical protein
MQTTRRTRHKGAGTELQVQGDALTVLDKQTEELQKQIFTTVPQIKALEDRTEAAKEASLQHHDELTQKLAELQISAEQLVDRNKQGAQHLLASLCPSSCCSADTHAGHGVLSRTLLDIVNEHAEMLAALDVSQKQVIEHQLNEKQEREALGGSSAVALSEVTKTLANMGCEIFAIKEQQDVDRTLFGDVTGGLDSQLAAGRCCSLTWLNSSMAAKQDFQNPCKI